MNVVGRREEEALERAGLAVARELPGSFERAVDARGTASAESAVLRSRFSAAISFTAAMRSAISRA